MQSNEHFAGIEADALGAKKKKKTISRAKKRENISISI